MKLLLTGSSAALARRLAAAGHEVREGGALAGCDAVVYVVATDDTASASQRAGGAAREMLALLEAATAAKLSRLVVVSTAEPAFAAASTVAEQLALAWAQEHFDRALVVRAHDLYGPDLGWHGVIPRLIVRLARLRTEAESAPPVTVKLPLSGGGAERRAFLHLDALAAAVARLAESGAHRQLHDVGGPDTTVAEAARTVARLLGIAVDIEDSGAPAGPPPPLPALREPRVPLEVGLIETVDWYAANVHRAPEGLV